MHYSRPIILALSRGGKSASLPPHCSPFLPPLCIYGIRAGLVLTVSLRPCPTATKCVMPHARPPLCAILTYFPSNLRKLRCGDQIRRQARTARAMGHGVSLPVLLSSRHLPARCPRVRPASAPMFLIHRFA